MEWLKYDAQRLFLLLAKPFAPRMLRFNSTKHSHADDIEGRCGKGFVKIKGAIPVIQRRKSRGGDTWDNLVARADTQAGLKVDIQGLDVRARNAYNGQVKAGLVMKGPISAPEVGGSVQLSKGQVTATPGQPETLHFQEAKMKIKMLTFQVQTEARMICLRASIAKENNRRIWRVFCNAQLCERPRSLGNFESLRPN